MLPKQVNESGLKKTDIQLPIATIEKVVEQYTNESGVARLEKKAKIVRNRAKEMAMEEPYATEVKPNDLKDIPGRPREKDRYQNNDVAELLPGLHGLLLEEIFYLSRLLLLEKESDSTGNLGDVMKESAIIALEYLKAHSKELGIDPDVFDK